MSEETGRHEPGEEYAGVAVVLGEGVDPVEVEVQLRGHFQPIDGRFHWYGRIEANEVLASEHRPGARIALRTPYGTAAGKIADLDPWGRYRVTGLGTPPF
ncbi:MAG: DUF4873 domain-containing protein [Marmoricola sp.]